MFKIKRNQIIISALIVMIVVAGYLNYIDQSSLNKNDAASDILLNESGEVSALILDDVSGTGNPIQVVGANTDIVEDDIGIALTYDETVPASSETDRNVTDAGVAVFVNSTSDSSFFVQAKLEREQAVAKQKEVLTELINMETVEAAQKAECANEMLAIQQRIAKESATEAMIESKGFSEAYVRIDDNTVDVVVSKSVLSDAEIAQIEDIVKRKTGIAVENIRISSLKQQ